MHQIEVGLRSREHPSYGGWGGRFVEEKPGQTSVWKDAEDEGSIGKPIWRWAEAFQHDFAARAEWCVKTYADANHPPAVWLTTPADVEAAPGATVKLDVSGSTDPDGDKLSVLWWHYKDAGKLLTPETPASRTPSDRRRRSPCPPMRSRATRFI